MEPDLGALTAVAVYAVLWGFVFAECGLLLGFLLPGDTILFAAGLLAADPRSEVSLPLLIAGTFVAAVAGNEVGYLTGRRYGRTWIESRERGRAVEQLRRTEAFYARWGALAVVDARWIPWVRTFTPLVAGAARMPRRTFSLANVAGALPWAVGLPLLGYAAYQLPVLRSISYVVAGIAIAGSVVAALVVVRRDRAASRDRPERDGSTGSGDDASTAERPSDDAAVDEAR